jgi:HEAT repeat protein
MHRYPWHTFEWLAAVIVAIILYPALPAFAQDPFADAPVVGEDAEGEEEAAEEGEEEEEEIDPNDPVLLAVQDSNPTTPDELIGAIEKLLRIGAKTAAKEYLQKLVDGKPNEAVLADLMRDYGSGMWMRIGREPKLQPEGAQLSRAAFDAAFRQARDPARIEALIKDLSSPDEGLRRSAVLDLRNAGDAAVNPMLKVLADPARAAEHRYVRWGLTQLRKPAVEPLIGALQTQDTDLKNQVLQVLGDMKARRATMYAVRPFVSKESDDATRKVAGQALMQLVGQLPDRRDAERYLLMQARSFLGGAMPLVPDHNGLVKLWHWNPETKVVVPVVHLGADAARIAAGHAAGELYLLRPENPEYRRLYLTATLSSAKVVTGLDRTLPEGPGTAREAAKNMGAEAVEDVLAYAMGEGHFAAAIGAAEVLGDFGDRGLLASTDGQPRPLAQALAHPNRRLRAAAADAIMRIDPSRPFAGSSGLPETLGYLSGTAGLRRALVGHPRPALAQSVAGMLAHMAFDADTAFSGRNTFLKAVQSPDYEFLLISDGLDMPGVTELLQMLRRDRRTAALPIGIMARSERLDQLRNQHSFDRLTEVFPTPQDDESANLQARRLLALAGRHLVPDDERIARAEKALDHLAALCEDREKYSMYDVLRQQEAVTTALYVPELSAKAARVLGLIGSPQAQQALVDLASRHALPLKQRQAAAKAFADAAARRNVLLTKPSIRLQYDRYNESESFPVETQEVLGSILDTIEQPRLNDEQADAEIEVPAPEDAPGEVEEG